MKNQQIVLWVLTEAIAKMGFSFFPKKTIDLMNFNNLIKETLILYRFLQARTIRQTRTHEHENEDSNMIIFFLCVCVCDGTRRSD